MDFIETILKSEKESEEMTKKAREESRLAIERAHRDGDKKIKESEASLEKERQTTLEKQREELLSLRQDLLREAESRSKEIKERASPNIEKAAKFIISSL